MVEIVYSERNPGCYYSAVGPFCGAQASANLHTNTPTLAKTHQSSMFGRQARNSGLQRWNMTAPHSAHCVNVMHAANLRITLTVHSFSSCRNTFTLKTGFPTLALVLQGAGKVHKVHQELVGAGAGVRLGQSWDWMTALGLSPATSTG